MNSRVEISRANLLHNLSLFESLLNSSQKIACVLKSNAYGHGISEIYQILEEAGKDSLLAVNSVEEALYLRNQKAHSGEIVIMGEIPNYPSLHKELADSRFWIISSRLDQLRFYDSLNPSPKLHLKVDTGMGRLGARVEDVENILEVCKLEKITLSGICTHFASTEDFQEYTYTHKQFDSFLGVIKTAKDLEFSNLIRHCASSAATMLFPETRLDVVRIGISLYGLWPSEITRRSVLQALGKDFELKPVLSWKTQVQHLQTVPKDSFIGYGSTYKTTRETKLAVLPVGYFEGIDRSLSNNGYFLVKGQRAKILGRICMNMTMIDVTDIPDVGLGEEVTLIGRNGDEFLSADSIAQWANTINYEIVTRIQEDIPRIIV